MLNKEDYKNDIDMEGVKELMLNYMAEVGSDSEYIIFRWIWEKNEINFTKDEIDDLVDFFISKGRNKDLVVYNCTSGYPVPFNDVCLLDILTLKQKYDDKVKSIGFSGHHLGIAVDIAAHTLGAEWIERHYTLDRTWKGTDHAASLEPDGLRKLIRDLKAVTQTLTHKSKDILDIEEVQRAKLKNKKV